MRFEYEIYMQNIPKRHAPGPGEASMLAHEPILECVLRFFSSFSNTTQKGISNSFLLILKALMRFQFRVYTQNIPTRHIPDPGESPILGHEPILGTVLRFLSLFTNTAGKVYLQPFSSNFKWSNEVRILSLHAEHTNTTYSGPRRSSYARTRANLGTRFAVFFFIFEYDTKGYLQPFSFNFKWSNEV